MKAVPTGPVAYFVESRSTISSMQKHTISTRDKMIMPTAGGLQEYSSSYIPSVTVSAGVSRFGGIIQLIYLKRVLLQMYGLKKIILRWT